MRDDNEKVQWYFWIPTAAYSPVHETWMDGDILRLGRKPPSADKDFQKFMAKVLKT